MKTKCAVKELVHLHPSDMEIGSLYDRLMSPWNEAKVSAHLQLCSLCRERLRDMAHFYSGGAVPAHVNGLLGVRATARKVDSSHKYITMAERDMCWQSTVEGTQEIFVATSYESPLRWREKSHKQLLATQSRLARGPNVRFERIFIVDGPTEKHAIKSIIKAQIEAGVTTSVVLASSARLIQRHFQTVKTIDFGISDSVRLFLWRMSANREFVAGDLTVTSEGTNNEYGQYFEALREIAQPAAK